MRILYVSDHGPFKTTFIKQDVEEISKIHNTLYVAFETNVEYPNQKTKTLLVKYPSYSFKSKVKWRLEKYFNYFNWYDSKFSNSLKKVITKFNPDIIHCQFAYESAKLLHNFQTTKPVVLNFRGYGSSYKLRNYSYVKWLKKTLQNKNVFPIFVSKSLHFNLTERNIFPKNNGIILYTGIDYKKFTRTDYLKKNVTTFLQVSNFNRKKGHITTINAFKKALNNNPEFKANLVFIGNGKYLNEYKKLVDAQKLSSKISFLGKLDQGEIITQMNKASVFVHHSVTSSNGDQEGIPNSILEAMSMELPILSTFHSGIPEAVEHKINGLLCEEYDVKTYSEQMIEIAKWDFLTLNREKVINKFSLEKHLKNLMSFYEKIK